MVAGGNWTGTGGIDSSGSEMLDTHGGKTMTENEQERLQKQSRRLYLASMALSLIGMLLAAISIYLWFVMR